LKQIYFHIDFLLGGLPNITASGGLLSADALTTELYSNISSRPTIGNVREVCSVTINGTPGSGVWNSSSFVGPYWINRNKVPVIDDVNASTITRGGYYGQEETELSVSGATNGPGNNSRVYVTSFPQSQGWNWVIFRNFAISSTGTVTVQPDGIIGGVTGQIFVNKSPAPHVVRATYADGGKLWPGHLYLYFNENVSSTGNSVNLIAPGVTLSLTKTVGVYYTVSATWIPSRSNEELSLRTFPVTFDFFTVSLTPVIHPAFAAIAPATLTLRPTSSFGFSLPSFSLDIDRIVRSVNRMSKVGIKAGELARKGGKVLTTVAGIFACFPLTEEIAIPAAALGVSVRKGGEAVTYVSTKVEKASDKLIEGGYLHEPLSEAFKEASRVGVPLLGAAARGLGAEIKDEAIGIGSERIGELVADIALGIL
jgi:hypothetical protein